MKLMSFPSYNKVKEKEMRMKKAQKKLRVRHAACFKSGLWIENFYFLNKNFNGKCSNLNNFNGFVLINLKMYANVIFLDV